MGSATGKVRELLLIVIVLMVVDIKATNRFAVPLAALSLTVAGMASKGLEISMYQVTQHFIDSRNLSLPRIPLFAIPVVISRIYLIIN